MSGPTKTVPAREVKIEILRTRTVDERAQVTLAVPVHLIGDPDEMYLWVEQLKYTDPAQHRKLENASYEEDDETSQIREVNII